MIRNSWAYKQLRSLKHRYTNRKTTIDIRVQQKTIVKHFLTNSLPLKIAIRSMKASEKEVTTKFLEEVQETDTVWDIGANLGVVAVLASDVCKLGHIHAFEPDPRIVPILEKNFRNNHCNNFTIHPFAIGNQDATLQLYDGGEVAEGGYDSNLGSGKLINLAPEVSSRESFGVEVRRGAAIVDKGIAATPDALKIDVEGAVYDVLTGLGDKLSSVRVIFIEIHPHLLPHFNARREDVLNLLQGSGFTCELVSKRGDADSCGQEHYICRSDA